VRAAVWRNTLIAAAIYAVAIVIADRFLMTRFAIQREMSLALAFAVVQIAAIAVMVTALFVRKQRSVLRLARSRKVVPLIQEALALHAIGIDQSRRLQQLRRQSPDDVRETLFNVLVSMRGQPHERVSALAGDLGFVEQRGQETIEWVRNVIRVGHAERFEQIVNEVARQNLLVRAIAAEELATYAASIPESQIAGVLRSSDPNIVVTALDMLRAWRRALHVRDFMPLLVHADARVRASAFLALPYAVTDALPEAIASPVIESLDHENAEVRAAAATAVGRMGLTAVANSVALRLTDSDRHVAVAAAFALAAMGERGNVLLNRAVLSPDRNAASVAFEALEKSALGLAELR